jgi:hypothetical protein
MVTHFVVSLYCAACGFKAPVFWPKVCLSSEPPSKARLPPACLSQNMFLFINTVGERFVGWFAECEWTNGENVVVNWSVFVVLLLIRSVLFCFVLFYNPVITWKKYLNGLSKWCGWLGGVAAYLLGPYWCVCVCVCGALFGLRLSLIPNSAPSLYFN